VKGIIGLPANLFFGTSIPACIILLDKENASARKGIFFIDASKGFVKDGNKNRLREQDIHKIVDVFNNHIEINKFSRMVPMAEIEEKGYNLNIPRYIDNTELEDLQNIDAHLNGGIPNEDIEALQNYWDVYPSMKADLFIESNRKGFSDLKITKDEIKKTIFGHPEFNVYSKQTTDIFNLWRAKNAQFCKSIDSNTKPKEFIHALSEDLLKSFTGLKLIDKYDLYQHLMTYWLDAMQDDTYLIVSDGWAVGNEVEYEKKEFEGKLIPKSKLVARYFNESKLAIENLEAEREACTAELESLEEEYSGEDGYFTSLDKVNKGTVAKRLKDIKADKEAKEEIDVLNLYLKLNEQQSEANKKIKEYTAELDKQLLAKYKSLTVDDIKLLVVENKWMAYIEHSVKNEMQRISQRLTIRVRELAERYESTLPGVLNEVKSLEEKVNAHLSKMGYSWN
jgi:type I restriction enzyme M protein